VDTSNVKLGLIGAGKWGNNYISTISELPGTSLSWIVSTKHHFKGVNSNCKITSNWHDLINAQDLDGIIFAVPPLVQSNIALSMMRKKIPLLLEKPLALDYKSSKLLMKASLEFGVYVQVNHIYLFHPAYKEIFNLLHLIGNIQEIHSIGGNWGPFRDSHSALWDWMPHDVSMCMKLIGAKPKVISAEIKEIKGIDGNIGEVITTELEFHNNIMAYLSCGNGFQKKKRFFQVIGERGNIIFDDLDQYNLRLTIDGNEQIIICQYKSPLSESVSNFVNGIVKGNNFHSDIEFSVDVVSVISEIEVKAKY
jgi:predicted dehydrogenase